MTYVLRRKSYPPPNLLLYISGCSAAGSALDWGSRGRKFKSCHSDQKKSTCYCKCFFQFYSPCGEFYCFAVIYGFQPSDIALRQLKKRIEYHCDEVAISLLRKQKYHAEQSEAYH